MTIWSTQRRSTSPAAVEPRSPGHLSRSGLRWRRARPRPRGQVARDILRAARRDRSALRLPPVGGRPAWHRGSGGCSLRPSRGRSPRGGPGGKVRAGHSPILRRSRTHCGVRLEIPRPRRPPPCRRATGSRGNDSQMAGAGARGARAGTGFACRIRAESRRDPPNGAMSGQVSPAGRRPGKASALLDRVPMFHVEHGAAVPRRLHVPRETSVWSRGHVPRGTSRFA